MTDTEEFYTRLGVDKAATAAELRKAFTKLVLTAHPDKGGDEAEFAKLHEAYEVLIDPRKRRVYDKYGMSALARPAEALFSSGFRGGEFAGVSSGDPLKHEVEHLRRENDALHRQMLIVKPEAENKYASSFEAWLRNRDPKMLGTITTSSLMEQLGVCDASYEKVTIPTLRTSLVQYRDVGRFPEVCEVATQSLPTELKWGEVLVHMLAAPITPLDRQLAAFYALHDVTMPQHPAPAGSEGVAIVLRTGPGVTTMKEKDLVLSTSPICGTWRQLFVAPAKNFMPLPSTDLAPTALSTLLSVCTAYRLLEDFGSLRPGDVIIQSNATSLVGQAVIQLCNVLKIKTINLIEDTEDFETVSDTLQALGASYVWKNSAEVQKRFERARVPQPRLGIDCLGGATLTRICEALHPEGTMVVYAATTSRCDRFPYIPLFNSKVAIHGFWMWHWLKTNSEAVPEMLERILPLVEEKKVELDVSVWGKVAESFFESTKDAKNVVLNFATVEEALKTVPSS